MRAFHRAWCREGWLRQPLASQSPLNYAEKAERSILLVERPDSLQLYGLRVSEDDRRPGTPCLHNTCAVL
jgi:hypothetical protein